jgi:hypothetical protein
MTRRRRRKSAGEEVVVGKKPSKRRWDKPELEDTPLPRTHGRAELEGSEPETLGMVANDPDEERDKKSENVVDEKERVFEI